MKAVAPHTGVDIVDRAHVPGLVPEPGGAAERLVTALTGANGTAAVSYGTEGGIFQRAGWSTIVCGPGDIARAHQADEFITQSEMAAGEAFLARLIAHLSA
jgi:acetylornithine deacetylase